MKCLITISSAGWSWSVCEISDWLNACVHRNHSDSGEFIATLRWYLLSAFSEILLFQEFVVTGIYSQVLLFLKFGLGCLEIVILYIVSTVSTLING